MSILKGAEFCLGPMYEKHKSRRRTQYADFTTNFATILRQILFFLLFSDLLYLVLLLKWGGYQSLHPHFFHDSFLCVDFRTSDCDFSFFHFKVDCFLLFSVKERYSGKNMKYYDEFPQMAILHWVWHS
jgi:hypothetical protein